jgi:hypothetical protein
LPNEPTAISGQPNLPNEPATDLLAFFNLQTQGRVGYFDSTDVGVRIFVFFFSFRLRTI